MKHKEGLQKGLYLNFKDSLLLAFCFSALALLVGPPRGEAAGNAGAGDLSGGLDAMELLEPLEGDYKDVNFTQRAVEEVNVAEPVDAKLSGKIEPAGGDIGLGFDDKLFIANLIFEATGQTEEAKRQILQDRITSLGQGPDEESKSELQKILEQIRRVEFRTAEREAGSVTVTKEATSDDPNETKVTQQTPEKQVSQQAQPQIEQFRPEGELSEQILRIFNDVSGDLSQLENPVELADILYLGGMLKEAGIVYREAINRIDGEGTDAFGDGAWLLFQLANCLRDEDPTEARKFYREMISRYPECPWVGLAKAEDELLGWLEKVNPKALLEDKVGAEKME